MSYTIRVKGYAYEQKLVGFKDANSFNEKVDENDDNLFYDLLDEAPDYCKELAHQYVLSGEGEVQLLDEEMEIKKLFKVSDLRRMQPSDLFDRKAQKSEGYALAIGEEYGFYETYELPEGITAKNFNIANLYCYTTKFDEKIDVESFTEDGMQTGELYYISDKELRDLCKEETNIVKKSIEDYSDDSFDSYDQADLLAALLSGGSERANKYLLSYNGDAECSDREVKGYLFHKEFKSVTLL